MAPVFDAKQSAPVAGPCGEIAGVRLGQTFDEAGAVLDRIGERDGHPTRDGGKRYAWKIKDEASQFGYVVVRSNREGKITALTGMARPGREIPFGELGDTSKTLRDNEAGVVWDGQDASGKVTHRLVAKGQGGKAQVIYLLAPPRRGRNEVNVLLTPEQQRALGEAVEVAEEDTP